MARYLILNDEGEGTNTIVADDAFVETYYPGRWELLPDHETVVTDPAAWLMDIGPFFDRFGAAKLPILASADATVRALVTDLQVRKWIDLKRADVSQGIDLLISKGLVQASAKAAILTDPVQPIENLALRKTYFA